MSEHIKVSSSEPRGSKNTAVAFTASAVEMAGHKADTLKEVAAS